MFDELTEEARGELVAGLNDQLAEGAGLAVSAAEGFLEAVAADENYRNAYVALREALGLGGWSRAGTSDERLRLIDVQNLVRRVWEAAELTRRPDGLRNPYRPDEGGWVAAEYLLDRVGQPVALSDLPTSHRKTSGPAAADLVVHVANENLGRLAPGKTKVGGKVAYLVRESDERPAHDRWSTHRLGEDSR